MVHQSSADELGFTGVWGTGGGQCLFEFDNGAPFSYSGTRIAHGNPFGFASRWSGQWIIHGEKGDIKRVVAASAGNHAQGVAFSAKKLLLKATIVMPITTPSIKVNSVKNLGAKVVLYGDNFDEAYS